MFAHEAKRLSSQLALVSKAIDSGAANIEGALHVPNRPKRRKPGQLVKNTPACDHMCDMGFNWACGPDCDLDVEDDLFAGAYKRINKFRPDQARDDHGRFEDEGKGTGDGGGSTPVGTPKPEHVPTVGQRAARIAMIAGGGLLGYGALRGASNLVARQLRASRLRSEAADAARYAALEAREAEILRGHLTPTRKPRLRRVLDALTGANQKLERAGRARMLRQARAARAKGKPGLTPQQRKQVRTMREHGQATLGDPSSKMPPDVPFWPF